MSEGQSTTSPLFENSAQEVADRLGNHRGEAAMAMAAEARQLVEEFKSWRGKRPQDHVRINAIRQLFDLHRRAMDFLAQQPHMPSGDAPLSGGHRR